jgi:hypothetical protein
MKKNYVKILLFLLVVVLCGCAAVLLSRPVESEDALVKEKSYNGSDVIVGYKQWTRVNPEPQMVASRIAIQCADPRAAQYKLEDQNPHRNKFVVVYVNDIGREAMMEQKVPRFPQGSVVVKEKLSTKDSRSPELLTVMRKREPGYDPAGGDWEYIVFDGAGKAIQASGKLENCQACHKLENKTDYIARSYLPDDVWNKLK